MPYPYRRSRAAAAVTAAVALALPAAADAHVTLQPSSAPAGGFTRLNVRVPNERDDSATNKVDVRLPAGFAFVSYEPRPGWTVTVKRTGDAVSQITWTGHGSAGKIAPGQFMDFGLSLRMPNGQPGDKLTFKAVQTYDNGEVVRWIGPEEADEPAPIVTLTGANDAAPATTNRPVSASTDDDGGGDGLAIAALVLGALGLAAGVAALVRTRRSPVRV